MENFLCDIFPVLNIFYAEIMDRRYVTFFGLYGLGIDKLPCGVRIVINGKFFLFAILLQDEGCFKLRLLSTFWYFHAFLDVCTDVVWAEIKERQTPETPNT